MPISEIIAMHGIRTGPKQLHIEQCNLLIKINSYRISNVNPASFFNDSNEAVNFSNIRFVNVLNRHAPRKTQHVKHDLQPNWLIKEIDEVVM